MRLLNILLLLFLLACAGCGNFGFGGTGSGGTNPAAPNSFIHGPRLGFVNASSATISWNDCSSQPGQVNWGTSSGTYPNSTPQNGGSGGNHVVTLTGLSEQTVYHYQVVSGGLTTQDLTFTTAASSNTPFTFISMADCRGPNTASDSIRLPQAFYNIVAQAVKCNAGFCLFAGDLFYGASDLATQQLLYDNFKTATDPLALTTPFLVSPGNHEIYAPTGSPPSFDPLALFNQNIPQPNVYPGYQGTFFSWEWGNSHFTCVDTCHYQAGLSEKHIYQLSGNLLTWLGQDLAAAKAKGVRHMFVFGHSHAFDYWGDTLSFMGSWPGQSEAFWNVLETYKVDAYICGHVHRSDSRYPSGSKVMQWVNGDSGCVTSPSVNKWTLWSINGDTATAQLYDDSGNHEGSPVVIHSSQ